MLSLKKNPGNIFTQYKETRKYEYQVEQFTPNRYKKKSRRPHNKNPRKERTCGRENAKTLDDDGCAMRTCDLSYFGLFRFSRDIYSQCQLAIAGNSF